MSIDTIKDALKDHRQREVESLIAAAHSGITVMPSQFLPSGRPVLMVPRDLYDEMIRVIDGRVEQ